MKKLDVSDLNSKYLNYTFNKLTIRKIYYENKHWKCLCDCECGKSCIKELNRVISGHTKTCGSSIHKKEQGKLHSQYYKDHPEVAEQAAEKIKQWYNDNEEIINKRSKQHRVWWDQNRNNLSQMYESRKKIFQDERLKLSYSALLKILHPAYVEELVSGKISRNSVIETLCPICQEYCKHTFHNVYRISTDSLKYDSAPICQKCKSSLTASKSENTIAEFISSFYTGKLIRNDRQTLNGKELDLYYPEKKIAIEFNGDYWHDEDHRSKDYHISKFKECCSKDILLVSIFESEWNRLRPVIEKYLLDLFNGVENELSFKDTYMNNNYPSLLSFKHTTEYIENYYIFRNKKVYTCGYSVINSNYKLKQE